MNNCPFSVGDTVRRLVGTSSNTKPGFVGKIKRIYSGQSFADLHFEDGAQGTYWLDRPDGWERVPAQEEPKSAERGTYLVVEVAADGSVSPLVNPQHVYWVDAEADAARMAEAVPRRTSGVLKLIGTVSMKPTWSDPQE